MTGQGITGGGLIGRAEELGVLASVLRTAAGGQAGVAFVSGAAGAGKTRLTDELATIARGEGHTVLIGQCAELGEAVPYMPLADALWNATRDPNAPPALREALHERPLLTRLLPGSEEEGGPATAGDAELTRQQMFGVVLSLLGELADAAPVLLVFEDLHWADRSTRDLLTFLSRMLQRERVCLVGTYRADDLHRRHPLRPVVAELLRLPGVTGVEVRPLPPKQMAEYLTSLVGEPPPSEVLDRVIERAEGNPFYAGELYAEAVTGAELPALLADLLLAGVERMSELARQVVRVAAVAGRRVDDDLIREVSGLDQVPYEQAFRELVSHQLLVPESAGLTAPAAYAFRHALLREAIYADLLPGERTRLHAAFAEQLVEDSVRRNHSTAELAYHSLASHNLAGALEASVEAGHEAERLGAPADAHEHFDQALELWDAVPGAERLAGLDRPHLELRAAATAAHSGDTRRAVSRLRRLAGALDESAANVDLRAEVLERLAHNLTDADEDTEAIATARAALELLPAESLTPLRARALATCARAMHWSRAVREAEIQALAEEAIAIGRAVGAPDAEAGGLVTLGLYAEAGGEVERSQELFASAREAAGRAGDLSVALRAAFQLTRADFDRGQLAKAAATADDGVRFAVGAGLAWATYGVELRFLQYLVHYTSGGWDRAEALADSFGIMARNVAEAIVSAYALFIEVARGSDAVRERLRWLEPLWPADELVAYIARGLAAEHALWENDADAAIEHITALLETERPADASIIRLAATGLRAYGLRAERARAKGDVAAEETAVFAADDLIERARWAAANTHAGPRAWLGVEGRAWLARAEAEWNWVKGKNDPEMWRAATEAFGYGFVYEVARSQWRLAECLLEHGKRDEAEVELRQAIASAERLGATPLHTALRELAHRARFDTDSVMDTRSSVLSALTSREREVLRLVAGGQSNREIAAALFISPKTASVHLSNILTKLGATNRTQAAAIAHREGLTP